MVVLARRYTGPLCSLPRRSTISAVTKHVKMRQNEAYRSGPVGTPYIPLTGVRMCRTRARLCVGSMHQPTAPCAATAAVEYMPLCSLPHYSQILTFSHRFSQILTDSSTAHAAYLTQYGSCYANVKRPDLAYVCKMKLR